MLPMFESDIIEKQCIVSKALGEYIIPGLAMYHLHVEKIVFFIVDNYTLRNSTLEFAIGELP